MRAYLIGGLRRLEFREEYFDSRAAFRSRPTQRAALLTSYTGLGQINAAAFNIRPSVRDRDRDGMATLLVGDLDFRTKGQPFVRRRHDVVVERNAAGSFGFRLRRVSHGVHRCDTVFGTNWNVEQTKYERGDQPSHA
jgi:hypothetical protein